MGTNLFYKLVTPQCIPSAQGLALDLHTCVSTCLLGICLAYLRGTCSSIVSSLSVRGNCDFYLLRSQFFRGASFPFMPHSNLPANSSGSSFKICPPNLTTSPQLCDSHSGPQLFPGGMQRHPNCLSDSVQIQQIMHSLLDPFNASSLPSGQEARLWML